MRHKVRSPACRAACNGSWKTLARYACVAYRRAHDQSNRFGFLGLRLARRCS